MKLSSYPTIIILLLLCFPLNINGQNIEKEQLIGTWILNYEASTNLMKEKAKKHYEKMGAERQEKVKRAYQNRIITFETNGNFIQELEDGRKVTGTWLINKNKLIEMVNPNGAVKSYRIKKLDTETLIMSRVKTDDNKMNMLISDWYLIKS